jgi:glucose-6-phosphate isomerase/transaldolase/glucose-6-phosphate isomerase
MDIEKLLDKADRAREGCASDVAARDNTGAWLGAVVGTLASKGRDKLTLVTSPSLASFGLWVDQLVAESTGKEGKGIVPIAGEPLMSPESYGDYRLFIYVRLEGDDNAKTDAAIAKLTSASQPVVRLDVPDRYEMGAEFYRWEFAIAVAGAVLQINPFDQPNVESAKQLSISSIQENQKSGKAPTTDAVGSISGLLSKAKAGDYLAIMAYINETPETNAALFDLRRRVIEKHGISTTLGYGPRFLHSTGQLHKGGANNGLFLQITSGHGDPMPIPGENYTFGILADAQASGDFGALQAEKRRVARIHLKSGSAAELKDAIGDIG